MFFLLLSLEVYEKWFATTCEYYNGDSEASYIALGYMYVVLVCLGFFLKDLCLLVNFFFLAM